MAKLKLFGLSTVVALVMAGTVAAPVDTAKAEGVYVYDVNKLWTDTKVGKDVQSQVLEYRQNLEKKFNEEIGKPLQTKVDELKKQKDDKKITEDEYKKNMAAIQIQLRQLNQQAGAALQAVSQKAQFEFSQAIRPHLESVAKAKKATVLMERSQAIYFDPKADVTAQAMKAIESKLTKLKIDLEPKQQAEAADKK